MKVKKKSILNRIFLILNLGAILALVGSYLACVTSPADNMIIALLGFGYQILLGINILFIAWWLIRRKIYFVISAIAIIAGYTLLSANIGFRFKNYPGPVREENDIRIMAYNVNKFVATGAREGSPSQESIADLILKQKPDIIGLEEYDAKLSDSGATGKLLSKALNSGYYYFKPFEIYPEDSIGNAVFSKYPIVKYDSVPSPSFLNNKAIFVDIKYKTKMIRVYCIHLAAVNIHSQEKSKYLNGKLNLDRSGFIKSQLSYAFIERSHQVSFIKRHMDECPYPYIIIGDFNDTPVSWSVNTIGDGLKNAFEEKGSGFGVTYYSKFPKLQIDYIMASPQFDIISYQAVDNKISDHKPVISDVRLK